MKLDQHFLVNEKIAKLMVSRCKIDENSLVVEIGPGNGEVTKFIPKCHLTLIEMDYELVEKLKEEAEIIRRK
jgi:16S rRNA A1518/A1519 N6-dimethyltransferase RsmA/KsgA/DIM1 with predicted DNA glycosylase/AP lyase activity